jgi:hypothetical protein
MRAASSSAAERDLNRLRSVMLYDSTLQPLTHKQEPHEQKKQEPQKQEPHEQKKHEQKQEPQKQEQKKHEQKQEPQKQEQKKQEPSSFRPGLNQDPLFWCFYVMKHGAFKYEQLANRFTAEQDSKRDEIMRLRETGKQLKQSTGIKFTASGMEGDIMSPRISLHAFQVLACLNSLNAVFVNPANHVYAEFIHDAVTSKPVFIVERNNKQLTMKQATEEQLASLRATNYRVENPQKPIKSISAYTVADLTEMCHELKIQLGAKMKKQELYDAVAQKLVL